MDKQELLGRIEAEKRGREDYPEFKDGIDFCKHLVEKYLTEPENPVVPKEFDEWYKEIQEKWSGNLAEQFALWKICQFGFGYEFEDVRDRDIESVSLINWVNGHKEEAIDAILYGYTTEKEPVWVVRINEKLYFCRFTDKYFEKDSNAPTYIESGNPSLIKKFTNKDKAKAVATLVDGEVEERSE